VLHPGLDSTEELADAVMFSIASEPLTQGIRGLSTTPWRERQQASKLGGATSGALGGKSGDAQGAGMGSQASLQSLRTRWEILPDSSWRCISVL